MTQEEPGEKSRAQVKGTPSTKAGGEGKDQACVAGILVRKERGR